MRPILLLLIFILSVAKGQVYETHEGFETQSMLQHMEYCRLNKNASIQDAQRQKEWQSNTTKWPTFSRDESLWLRLKIKNLPKQSRFYLNVWGIEKVSLFVPSKGLNKETGRHVRSVKRDNPNDPNYLSLDLSPNEEIQVFMKQEAGDALFFFSSLKLENSGLFIL